MNGVLVCGRNIKVPFYLYILSIYLSIYLPELSEEQMNGVLVCGRNIKVGRCIYIYLSTYLSINLYLNLFIYVSI